MAVIEKNNLHPIMHRQREGGFDALPRKLAEELPFLIHSKFLLSDHRNLNFFIN